MQFAFSENGGLFFNTNQELQSGKMTLQLKPSEIRYSQDSIKNKFNNGKRLSETFEKICDGSLSISAIPNIRVARINDHWFTLDNRRLWLFRELEDVGKCAQISVRKVSNIPSSKMTTENDGVSIRVRSTYIPDDYCDNDDGDLDYDEYNDLDYDEYNLMDIDDLYPDFDDDY